MAIETVTVEQDTSVQFEQPATPTISRERGHIGQPTPSLTMKQLWRKANCMPKKKGVHKMRRLDSVSLKQFARVMVKEGNTLASTWFANKDGATEKGKSDRTLNRLAQEKIAHKQVKSKVVVKK